MSVTAGMCTQPARSGVGGPGSLSGPDEATRLLRWPCPRVVTTSRPSLGGGCGGAPAAGAELWSPRTPGVSNARSLGPGGAS